MDEEEAIPSKAPRLSSEDEFERGMLYFAEAVRENSVLSALYLGL